MTPEQLTELEELARSNAVVHALLDVRRRRIMSDEDWMASALVVLAKQNSEYLSALVDARTRMPLPRVEGVERDGTKVTFRMAVSPEIAAAIENVKRDANEGNG